MECPQCHFENPPGTIRCTKCDSDFNLVGATVTSGVASGWSRPAQGVSNASVASPALQPGSVLGGRYEILQLLGEGGMGAVYKARDREVDRLVALKVIRPELANQPEVLRRFKQELILARQITHKNVIRIFDLGEADGIKFISMDYIEGQDLRSVLREKGKLAPGDATAVMVQVCQALEAAHAEGVVHRDLKPQNIMIDNQGRATVMDFGIARSMERTGMTQTGAMLGTPDYMSPEQAKGQEVDARSDLFTVGIIFYELLTGKTPYQADTVLGTLLKRTQERARPAIELDPAIPRYLNDVVARCLEIDPRVRYQKASEILADLEAHRRPQATTLRLRMPRIRMVEGHPIRWIAAALIAVPLIVLAIVFRAKIFAPPVKPTSSAPAVSLAILPFRNASGDPALDWLGPELAELLNTDVGQSAHLRMVSSDRVSQVLHDLRIVPGSALEPDTIRHVAEFTNTRTVVWGQYAKFGEQIRIDATLQDLDQQRTIPLKVEAPNEKGILPAIAELAKSVQANLALPSDVVKELQAKAIKPSSNSLQALRYYNEGIELARQGKNLEAQKKFQASTEEDPQFALAYSRLGQADAKLGYESEAEQASRKAVELADKLPAQEKYLIAANHARIMKDYHKAVEAYEDLAKAAPDDADVQFALAGLYEDTGDFDKARAGFAKVTKTEPKNADALLAMGRVEIESGNPQGGLDYLTRALTLSIELENDEQKAKVLQAIGAAYQLLRKPQDALRNYQQSLDIKRQLNDKLGIADSVEAMAQVQVSLGKPELARRNYLEAVRLRREIGDKKGLGDTLVNLGDLYSNLGQYDEVLKASKEGLQIEHEAGDKSAEGLALNNIGNAYLSKAQYEDARTYFEQALRLRQELKVPADIADTLHNLGETALDTGDFDLALNHYLRALELRHSSGDKLGEAKDSDSLAILFGYQGRYGAALKAEEEALKSLREVHEGGYWLADVMSDYGRALSQVGRFDEAQKTLEEPLGLARDMKNDALIAQALNFQGDRSFYAGDFNSARGLYEQALRTASRTSDRHLSLVSKFNIAKLAVKQGRSSAAISTLRGLAQEADTLGMKYLSVEASSYLAEALLQNHDYSKARLEIERAVARSEKMGLRAALARGHYLMAELFRVTGNQEESRRHLEQARQILTDIRNEAGESVMKRSDFAPISRIPS